MLSKIGQLRPVRFQFLGETELRDKGLPALNTKERSHGTHSPGGRKDISRSGD